MTGLVFNLQGKGERLRSCCGIITIKINHSNITFAIKVENNKIPKKLLLGMSLLRKKSAIVRKKVKLH